MASNTICSQKRTDGLPELARQFNFGEFILARALSRYNPTTAPVQGIGRHHKNENEQCNQALCEFHRLPFTIVCWPAHFRLRQRIEQSIPASPFDPKMSLPRLTSPVKFNASR
jgi:hypothetical protein